jgi:predicted ATPase/DNA-binding winged helix-turn-helix (wHTH) protein
VHYRFGRHTLDLDAVELRCDGDPVDLEPRSFAVLQLLVEQRHRVVPKTELLDRVWGDRFVSESALTTRIKHCRRALGDDGTAQRFIRTVHRVGYRFVAPVDTSAADTESPRHAPDRAGHRTRSSNPATEVFGRDRDMVQLAELLSTGSLVTVTGPGGVGKSRLVGAAVEQGVLTGDVWWCDLTATRRHETVSEVVLHALGEGRQSDADPLATIARVGHGRQGTVVLDNCEHLLDAVAPVVAHLTAPGSHLRVVATSRLPLDLPGEHVLVLAPLDRTAAIDCFVDRATAIGARLDRDDPAIGVLCDRLDRLPLALELAAARARLLTPDQIVELLDDRFRLLRRNDDADDEDMHHALAGTIGWSWDLLGEVDRQLLTELSVFVGSFALDDAAGVAMPGGDVFDVVDGLDRLLRASMLVAADASGGERRFRLLESIRDFAADQLAEDERARALRRHGAHQAQLLEDLDARLRTDHVDEALAEMTAAWPNVRAAVDHAISGGDLTVGRRIIRAAGAYADLFQAFEIIEWCERAALLGEDGTPATDDDPALVADALAIWARLLAHRGDHDHAAELAERAHAWHPSFATQLSLVWAAYYSGRLDQVITGAEQLLELSSTSGGIDQAYTEGFQAIVAAVRLEPVLTSTDVDPAEADRGLLGALRCLTAGFRLCAADPETAAQLLEAVVASSLRNDHRLLLGAAASTLTQITLPGRPPDEAMRTLCRTLDRYLERGMWPLISADTVMAAKLLADAGDEVTACRLLGARAASGYRSGISEATRATLHEHLRNRLGEEYDRLAAAGAEWTPPAAGAAAVAAMRRRLGEVAD